MTSLIRRTDAIRTAVSICKAFRCLRLLKLARQYDDSIVLVRALHKSAKAMNPPFFFLAVIVTLMASVCYYGELIAMRSEQTNYRIIDPPFTAIRQAIGLNKGHPEALGFVNETIADLLANGFVADSLKRHGVGDKLSLPR